MPHSGYLFTDQPYDEVVAGLRAIQYESELLQENYQFTDWFSKNHPQRQISAAAFGQTPISYESACIGVARANVLRELPLVNSLRALGAPIILEVDNTEVREWAVSRRENEHNLVARYPSDRIKEMLQRRAPAWKPQPILRAKNIGPSDEASQLSLFAGLVPELEERIQVQLEPLLRKALHTTKEVYQDSTGREPDDAKLFKLCFWVLTAKVFHDLHREGFIRLGSDPDLILKAVAKEYGVDVPKLLNYQAREAAVSCIWNILDFRHLSVEVLAQMWSTMLVTPDVRKRHGIHRTSRNIVRHIVERIFKSFQQPGDIPRIIFEPCSGSAAFLIGAMNHLRQTLYLMSPHERHHYFTNHLAGIERENIGVEISHLTLALADYPYLSGWTKSIAPGDVFEPDVMTDFLSRASVVLCNPPFESFAPDERDYYHLRSPLKPVELLHRVLDDLHPSGVLGFVLPRNIVDGRGYAEIRKRLAERFADVDLTVLPDRAFEGADTEVGLLVATEPIPHDTCQISFSKVDDNALAWRAFERHRILSSKFKTTRTVENAAKSFAVYELPGLWRFLSSYPTLKDVAVLHRGIEWNEPLKVDGVETGNRKKFESADKRKGFELGVDTQAEFHIFEEPRLSYLSLREEHQRGKAYKRAWDKPKAILNKSTRSRGHWRISAFPDSKGLVCYQTLIGAWPKSDDYDVLILSAILNSPLANAFVSVREGKTDITIETLNAIPIPQFSKSQRERLRTLVKEYQSVAYPPLMKGASGDPTRLLMDIDALVLEGYGLLPRLEHELLMFFTEQGPNRPTPQEFGNYLPKDCEVYFSLSTHLSPRLKKATIGNWLESVGFVRERRGLG